MTLPVSLTNTMLSSRLFYTAATLLTFASASSLIMQPGADSPFVASTSPSLGDRLTTGKSTIFAEYTRDVSGTKIAAILSSSLGCKHTLLVPSNSAIMALQHKPHEGPLPSIGQRLSQSEEETNSAYLTEWCKLHIVAGDVMESLLAEGEWDSDKEWPTMHKGRSARLVKKDNEMRVMPGDILVDRIESVS